VSLASRDAAVQQVLSLVAGSDRSWVNLYRVYEVIRKDVGGEGSLHTKG
jgi:hypothetical protein